MVLGKYQETSRLGGTSQNPIWVDIAIPDSSGNNYYYGVQEFSNTTPSSSTTTGAVIIKGGLGVQGNIIASSVYGAVWNDLADCITVPRSTVVEPGYCYCFDGKNYHKSSKYMDDGFIGIHSNTAGLLAGFNPSRNQIHAGIKGFVLAYVDKEYKPGTPLTCTENGYLTEISLEDKIKNPHKVIGTFWKSEPKEKWGPEGQEVDVNGRMWIKVK